MLYLKIADLVIGINNKNKIIEDFLREYLVAPTKTDFVISITDADIDAERLEGVASPEGYLESLAIYRKIASEIIDFQGMLMHGAVIDVDGTGIAFLAPSGTGKTTHMARWKKLFGSRLTVINGDKPILRVYDNSVKAYGTPWSGKEYLNTNTSTNLKKICFIQRAKDNSCELLNKNTVLEKLINQIYCPTDVAKSVAIIDMTELLIRNCEFYLIKCNMDISAAVTASEVMGI